MFALNPALDVPALSDCFARTGRVVIDGWLGGDGAAFLHNLLREREDWRLVVNSGDAKGYELDRNVQAGFSAEQRSQLDQAVYAAARYGFQYRFETIRVPDEAADRIARNDPLDRLATFMSEGPTRDLLRRITGQSAIDFADAQATAYSPGHFLTGHDDAVAGKNRHSAYVLGLTPDWRIEWGGLLLFHNADGTIDAVPPGLNRLTLFRVPYRHSVSEVTQAAARRRYSVTGWLRSAG